LNRQFPSVVELLGDLPAGAVVDGELVALDARGRPDFNLLQNLDCEPSRIRYYIFDLMCCGKRDLTQLPLLERRELLNSFVRLPHERIKIAGDSEAASIDLLSTVREQGLEGIVGKRKDSLYEAGQRSGAWIKYRVNRGHELVIGGYMPGPHGVDSIIVGYNEGENLIYVARVKRGFVDASRRQLFEQLRLSASECPSKSSRDFAAERNGLEGMKVHRPAAVVAQNRIQEWIEGDISGTRSSSGLRDARNAACVVKERFGGLSSAGGAGGDER
jgi:bifunctional non-homologous end joining protein LigD